MGKICVFTYSRTISTIEEGIKRITSTINSIEEISAAICEQEDKFREELIFYDLQTFKMYRKKEGYFEYDRVEFTTEEETRWIPVQCPLKVINIFKSFIGENPIQMGLSEIRKEED